jgi:hypothetical protein
MPEIRMNSLKSLAMICVLRPYKMISIAASATDSRMSQLTTHRLKPSRMLHK